jgi:DNA-binding response OmpR family regulator
MQLIYVTSARSTDTSEPPVMRLRLLGHTVERWDRGPATLVGRQRGEAVIVDAASGVPFARQYCIDLARLAVNAPVVAVVSAETLSAVSAEWAVSDIVLDDRSPAEFEARIRRALARKRPLSKRETAAQDSRDMWLDLDSLTVRCDGQVVALSLAEAIVLSVFFDHPNVVVSREMLLERVWLQSAGFASRNVDTFICRLRYKLGRHSDRITTVRGAGYKFVPEPAESALLDTSAA